MDLKTVFTADAPAPVGPYSQAIWCGDMLFVSGQLPIDPQTNTIKGTSIEEQTRQAVGNILAIMKAQGLGAGALVKTTVYLKDISHFAAFNKIYEDLLGKNVRPARSVIAAAALPRDALIEIEAVACR